MHVGKATKVAVAEGRRNLDAQAARDEIVRLAVEAGHGRIDPRDALELELWRTHLNVLLYESQVQDLPLDKFYVDLVHANGEPTGRALPNIRITQRDGERDRLAALAALGIKAGIEQHRMQLEEAKVLILQQAFEAMLDDMGLDATAKQEARKHFAHRLRLVE
jgi:hypothetical protein